MPMEEGLLFVYKRDSFKFIGRIHICFLPVLFIFIMKMKIFIAVLFIFILGSCNSNSQEINYINYHVRVYEAESFIVQNDHDSALKIYHSIFESFPHFFYKDLHNAAVCALKMGDFEKVYNYAQQLVLQGYEISDFYKSSFKDFVNNSYYWDPFMERYPELRKLHLDKQNLEIRSRYYELFLKDQEGAVSLDIYTQDSVFYNQSIVLTEMMLENGFPYIHVNNDTLDSKIFIQLRHIFGLINRIKWNKDMLNNSFYSEMNFIQVRLDSLMMNALYDGKISPQTYADIVSYWDRNPYGEIVLNVNFEMETIDAIFSSFQEDFTEINKKRSQIGLFQINHENDVFDKSWFNNFPFAEIKNAFNNCQTCKSIDDYMDIYDHYYKEYSSKAEQTYGNPFFLNSFQNIREIWLEGFPN
jgi:hypothetical protein